MDQKGYDIIGDIHGHAQKLIELLAHLGYRESQTGYCHPYRKVIFVGDFIDRGEHLKQHRQLLDIVMAMVNNNHALAVMGNHEFNALAFHTLHQGEYLRPRTDRNIAIHQAFLNEFDHDEQKKQEVLDFFYSLPVFLDLGDLRVLHACWHDKHVKYVKSRTQGNRLTPELLLEASTEGTLLCEAVETLLKGVEIKMPLGASFKDKDKTVRNKMRVRWWNRDAVKLSDVTLPINLDLGAAGDEPIPKNLSLYHESYPPCFIGHYWMNDEPKPLASNVACLDYSVASNGDLVAYRWSGEAELIKQNFSFKCEGRVLNL